MNIKYHYTEEEINILKAEFPTTKTQNLVEKLNKSYSSIASKASQLGLKKAPEFWKTEDSGRFFSNSANLKTRFQKGHIPANKGLKMTPEKYEKCKVSMFKKGVKPLNIKEVGYERINVDGYVEIKIKDNVFVLKHRLLWEQINGEIPKGYCVVFKDKNKQNICIENLEMITLRENMQRNSIHQYPEELKSAMKLLSKLKRKINEKQN